MLNFDRRQRYTFNKSFEQYVSTRVGAGRINGGRRDAAGGMRRCLSSIEASSALPRQICGGHLGAGDRFRQGRYGQSLSSARSRPWRMI